MADDVVRRDDRYEISHDGSVAGFVTYHLDGPRIVFVHTEIDPAFEGHGLGSRLAAGALADARARGLEIVARCPFIKRYMEDHPSPP